MEKWKCRIEECQIGRGAGTDGYCTQHYENLQSWINPNWSPPQTEDERIRLPLQYGGGLEPPAWKRK